MLTFKRYTNFKIALAFEIMLTFNNTNLAQRKLDIT